MKEICIYNAIGITRLFLIDIKTVQLTAVLAFFSPIFAPIVATSFFFQILPNLFSTLEYPSVLSRFCIPQEPQDDTSKCTIFIYFIWYVILI